VCCCQCRCVLQIEIRMRCTLWRTEFVLCKWMRVVGINKPPLLPLVGISSSLLFKDARSPKHKICISLVSFRGIPNSMRILKQDHSRNWILGFLEVWKYLMHCLVVKPFFLKYMFDECRI
jgi:hypothetical protein